jgi:glycosyltransferase involved in cell wall biosynthesis
MSDELAGSTIGFAAAPAFGRYRYGFDFVDRETGIGGSELQLLDNCAALASAGAAVTIFMGDRRLRHTTNAGAVVDFRPFREARSWRGDTLVVFRFGLHPEALPRGPRLIGWVTDPPSADLPVATPDMARAVGHIVVTSQYQATEYERFLDGMGLEGVDRPTLSVIPAGIFPDELPRAEKLPNQAIFCSVPEQGLDVLFDAWPRIRSARPDARLVVTSDYTLWGLPSEVGGWRTRFGQDQGVHVTGAIPRSRLLKLQAESSLHLHPALNPENFCISSLECQSVGTPSITSDVGAMVTTVENGRTGICVPAEPGETFLARYTEEILRLWASPGNLAAMAEQGRARAVSEFEYSSIARRWGDVLAE